MINYEKIHTSLPPQVQTPIIFFKEKKTLESSPHFVRDRVIGQITRGRCHGTLVSYQILKLVPCAC